MARWWVQLRQSKQITVSGRPRTYAPGDWVQVGKQVALRWIAEGAAYGPDGDAVFDGSRMANAGICVVGSEEAAKIVLADKGLTVAFLSSPALNWERTLIWNPLAPLRMALMAVGFALLDTWQVAVPLFDYGTLAINVGPTEERACTQEVIRDLRVPLYDTRMVFVKRCGETDDLIGAWHEEMEGRTEERLGFLRALYRTKPLVLALPVSWTGDHGPMEG